MSSGPAMDEVSDLLASISLSTGIGVSFQGKKLKLDNEKDCEVIIDAIKKSNSLHFLNLEGNTLGVEASKALAEALSSKPELKRALWKDMFTGRLKQEIPQALLNLTSGLEIARAQLTELDLSDNAFGPAGADGLAGLLSSPICYQLQVLRLNNNGLGVLGGKVVANALLKCYKNSASEGKPFALRLFVAGRNRLEDEGAIALSEVFKILGSLEEVALPQNGIYPPGIKALSKSFVNNPDLQVINLNDNTVRKAGALEIANTLPHLQKLRILNLGDCLLKNEGATLVANALAQKHADLEELYLSFNEIRSSGGMAVANAMKNKDKLKHVSLNGNEFGPEGCESLRNEMRINNKITSFDTLSEDEGECQENEEDFNHIDNENSETIVNLEITQTSFNSLNLKESLNNKQNDSGSLENQSKVLSEDDLKKLKKFFKCPVTDNFKCINKTMIIDYIKGKEVSTPEVYVNLMISIIMKISSLVCSSDEHLKTVIIDITSELYKKLFAWAHNKNHISMVNNSLIVYLGLIKSEEKDFKVSWNREGNLSVLKHAISKGIVPQSTKEILNCFLEKERGTYNIEEIKIS